MTKQELRQHPEYAKCVEKIKAYSKGFEFDLDFRTIPKAKANALDIILFDCMEAGLIECESIVFSLEGNRTKETYRRI
ncbi:MAG: hypothetical protein KBT03_07645 [Bacteroidales bacterium]|nr:hypothetical protein [Candidatus Scybalousia scybalohippi]